MSQNEPIDLEEQNKELELEQAKMERAKLELELEKMKQGSHEKSDKSTKPKANHTVSPGIIFCLTFLAPIGIILVWRLKEPIIIKIAATLYSLFAFSMLSGLLSFGFPTWFVFMGQ